MKNQCQPCPVRAKCTTSREGARNVGFPPRELRGLQARVRAEQQTPDWKTRHALRCGMERTMSEVAHGHGMRRCRHRAEPKAHLQHIPTAIAVNIERLSARSATENPPPDRRPPSRPSLTNRESTTRSPGEPSAPNPTTKITDRVELVVLAFGAASLAGAVQIFAFPRMGYRL